MGMFFVGVGATIGLIFVLSGVGNWLAAREKKRSKYEQIVECFNHITDGSGNFTRRRLLKLVMLELHHDKYYLQSLKKMLDEVEQNAS